MEFPYQTDDGTVVCPECEKEFKRVAYHWSQGRCPFPDIPQYSRALLTGMMLGDGTLRDHTNNPFVQTYMINKPFLEWLNNELDWLSTGVSMYRTAERSAELSRGNGYPDAEATDYHDVYELQTRTMPQFSMFEEWYGPDGKRFPDYLILTPTIAKIWYACDGSLSWDRRYPNARPHISIGVSNEIHSDGTENLKRMFEESTFDHVPVVDEHSIRFSVDESEDFLDWMGSPPDGFEYKWATDSLVEYEQLRDEALGDLNQPESQPSDAA